MDHLLQIKNISKTFPGIKALSNISFSLKKGEIHALLGENSEGKFTFIRINSRAQLPDNSSDKMFMVDNQHVTIHSPSAGTKTRDCHSISEIKLVPSLD